MTLNSFNFIILFAVLLVILCVSQIIKSYKSAVIMKKVQLIILLLFSFFYVYKSSWRFGICILVYAIFVYVVAIYLEKYKSVFFIGIVGSLMMLGYFKYTNFFLAEFSRLIGRDYVTLNIILPIGISFYTFSGLSYIIDVYRGNYNAKKDFLEVLLFICFFPKMTAGPIVRGKDFFPQFENYRGLKTSCFVEGIQIFVFGLFKKIVLADHLGVFVDDVFFAPVAYDTFTIALAVISYSLQIYLDFSGYSDMAIGIAKIIGFDFKPNFNLPYIAKGMSDFWKRWHISLSSWFGEYLYIPLGGSRKGNVRTYTNLLIVMIVSGLWHGAGLTFIIWGFLHGVSSCFSRVISKLQLAKNRLFGSIRMIVTYIIVTLLWVVFRASSLENACSIWKGMFTIHDGIFQPYSWSFFSIFCTVIAFVFAMIKTKKDNKNAIEGYYPILDLSNVISLALFFAFCGMTILLGYYGNTAFIYGKF